MPIRYENLPCPGCGKPMSAGDDVVTCPDCGAPQHRECWLRDSRCALSELHGGGYIWSPPESVELDGAERTPLQAHINRWEEQGEDVPLADGDAQESPHFFCPNCGRRNQRGNMQCENCGYLFFAPSPNRPPVPGMPRIWTALPGDPLHIPPETDLGGAHAGDLSLFIQRNVRVYLNKFKQLALEGKRIFFNVAAFFFHGYWFLYRKMYAAATIFLLVTLGLDFLQVWLLGSLEIGKLYVAAVNDFYDALSSNSFNENLMHQLIDAQQNAYPILLPIFASKIALGLIAGFVADRLYYKKSLDTVTRLRSRNPNEVDFQFAVLREGGVNFFLTAVAVTLMYIRFFW